ncbi:peptidyl-prolyl cis-trans isomerase [Myxococcota bacterium]|nr:peptidyl-prolyl cis-trans isomerase [Myxococcota bacterium]
MTRPVGKLLLFILVATVATAGCKPKKKEARHYVEASNPQEKANLEKGVGYVAKDGKRYIPVTSLKAAPLAIPDQKERRSKMQPYQAKNGKYYYFPAQALAELGIAPKAMKTPPTKPDAKTATKLSEADRKQVVATVNGESITVGELYDMINSRPPAWRRIFAKKEKKLEFLNNQIIVEKLLYDAAQKTGIIKDPVVQEAANKRMVDLLRRDQITKIRATIKVSEDEMKKYYEENKSQFSQPEGMIAAHILVKTKAEAETILKTLTADKGAAGRQWRALVTKHSIDEESKAKGGLLGTAKHRVVSEKDTFFEKPLVEAIWKLKKNGDVGGPVQTSKGWHVLKRYNKRKALDITFAQAKRRLTRLVERQSINKAYTEWVNSLKKKYNIKIFPENVKYVQILAEPEKPASATGHKHDEKNAMAPGATKKAIKPVAPKPVMKATK